MRRTSILLLTASLPATITAQCSVLNDNNIKTAVDAWISTNSREEAESTYGGPISTWNVSCVTNFNSLFKFSTRFDQDLTAWETKQVTKMDQLFEVATFFTANVSTWDTSNVVSMQRIFSRASNFSADLTGVSQWKTNSLKDIRYGFDASVGFHGDMTGWNLAKVNDMDHMFSDSIAFAADVSDWDLMAVTSLDHVFHFTQQFEGRVSGWKLSNALQTARYAFSEVVDFAPLNHEGQPTTFDEWNMEQVSDMSSLLQGAKDFDSDLIAGWKTPSLTTLSLAFSKSQNLHGTLESSWSTSKVKSFASLFATTRNFTSPLAANFDASNVTDMNSLFKYSHHFAGDVSQWDTSRVRTMEELALESVDFEADISAWNVERVTSLAEAFYSATNFPPSNIENWNTPELKNVRRTFDSADWATDEEEAHAICWDLNQAAHFALEEATCTSPGIGFDCDCINLVLAEIINAECEEPTPPCIGVVPTLELPGNLSSSEDATAEDSEDESGSVSSRASFAVLFLLGSFGVLFV